jgi:multisubunit Na+/H+ antiporter MnhF subunit
MRAFEIIIALVAAVLVFAVVKLLGLFLKLALVAALLGFVAGLLLARLFRR